MKIQVIPVVLLVLLLSKDGESVNKVLYSFSTHIFASIDYGSELEGYLNHPSPSNECGPLHLPPTNSTWFALLHNYSSCTLEKITNARNAGYEFIIVDGAPDNFTLSHDVRATRFPVIILTNGEMFSQLISTSISQKSIHVTVMRGLNSSYVDVTILENIEPVNNITITSTATPVIEVVPSVAVGSLVLVVSFLSILFILVITILCAYCKARNRGTCSKCFVYLRQQTLRGAQPQRRQQQATFAVAIDSQYGERPYNPAYDASMPRCSICLTEFEKGETVHALPCYPHHIFHRECIGKVMVASVKRECPLCRTAIV